MEFLLTISVLVRTAISNKGQFNNISVGPIYPLEVFIQTDHVGVEPFGLWSLLLLNKQRQNDPAVQLTKTCNGTISDISLPLQKGLYQFLPDNTKHMCSCAISDKRYQKPSALHAIR